MSDAIQKFIDITEIQQVLQRYAHGVNTANETVLRSCFADDARVVWDLVPPCPAFDGEYQSFHRKCMASLKELKGVKTYIANMLVDVSGNGAQSSSCVVILTVMRNDCHYSIHGRFEDKLVRSGESWRIVHRRFHRDMAVDPYGVELASLIKSRILDGEGRDDAIRASAAQFRTSRKTACRALGHFEDVEIERKLEGCRNDALSESTIRCFLA